MAAFVFSDGPAVLAPNPFPERGASYCIDANGAGTKLVYGSGYSTVIRDVDNPADCQVYVGHKKRVSVAKFSPDGRLVASGDASGVLRVWDAGSLETKKELPCLGGALNDASWDDTGKRLAVCGDAKGVNSRVFMWESGSPQGELASSAKRMLSVSIRPDKPSMLALGSEDFKVRLHAGPPYKFTTSFEGHGNFVQCVRYSPCGTMLATASSDKQIYILDAESGEVKCKLPEEHKGSVYCVSWSDDASQLFSCSGDKSVKLWDVKSQKCAGTVTLGRAVGDMQVGGCMAGKQPVSLSLCGDINYVDFASGKLSRVVQAHTSMPVSLARDWAADGTDLYVGTADGDAYAYDGEGRGRRFEGGKPGASQGIVVAKGKLYYANNDDDVRTASVGGGEGALVFASSSIPAGGSPVGVDTASGDTGLCVTATATSVVLARDGRVKDTKAITGYEATCVAMSEDGSEVAVGGSDKAVHIFSVSGDKLKATEQTLGGLQGAVGAVAFSPSGQHIAVGDKVKEVTLWDRASKEVLIKNKWVFHQSAINCLAFSPSGQHLASGSVDTQVIVWNVDKKMAKTKIPAAHSLGVYSVAWVDGTTLASGGGDGCIRKWTPKLP